MSEVFATNLVHFVRYLRGRGLAVVPATAGDLALAIQVVGLTRRDDVYSALRSLVVMRPTEVEVFDQAFELFFGSGHAVQTDPLRDALERVGFGGESTHASTPVLRRSSGGHSETAGETADVVGGSYTERLSTRDFSDLTLDEKEQVRRLIARMIWRPATARSRRWEGAVRGSRPDMRRTLRTMVRPEGDLIPLAMRSRKLMKRPLIVLADISGSMEQYTEMFLHFIHAAQGRLGRVESFVFATRLSRITRQMRIKTPDQALQQVAGAVQDWSGGTRIGEALETFNRQWSRRVTGGGAIGLIISDGWDTGEPAVLGDAMARFARSVHRVIWLNPLAGRPGFAPETRGLVTVLPYVDDFLAAGRLDDLRSVVRLLESLGAAPGPRPASSNVLATT